MSLIRLFGMLLLVATETSSIYLKYGPADASVRVGQSVEFNCDFNARDEEIIYWSHIPSYSYLTSNRDVIVADSRMDRYSLFGSTYFYEFNLHINDVQPDDGGTFYCGYFSDNRAQDLGWAKLTVLVPPDEGSPICQTGLTGRTATNDSSTFMVGDTVDLICSWTGGNPSPTALWHREDTELSTYRLGRYRLASPTLALVDNGVMYTCKLDSVALDEPRTCSVIPLRLPPNVTVVISPTVAEIGDGVSVFCTGSDTPRKKSYSWETNPMRTVRISISSRTLYIENVTRNDVDLVVTCTVQTTHLPMGKASAVVRINLPTTKALRTTTQAPRTTTQAPRITTDIATDALQTSRILSMHTSTRPSIASPETQTNQQMIVIFAALGVVIVVIIVALVVVLRKCRNGKETASGHITSERVVDNRTYGNVGDAIPNHVHQSSAAGARHEPGHDDADQLTNVVISPPPRLNHKGAGTASVSYSAVTKKYNEEALHPPSTYENLNISPSTNDEGAHHGMSAAEDCTYINRDIIGNDSVADPRSYNAEGLTYAELELSTDTYIVPSVKDTTVYATLST